MGRAKLKMELITKEKSRNLTFKKRKEGLIRKLQEFTTLCDVSACIIIYGPKQQNGAVEPEIWPQNMDEINRIIGIYKAKNKDSGNKTFGLPDFFHNRTKKAEDELAKIRKKNMDAKYPTWFEWLNEMTEAQLREFAALLSNKAEYVKSMIELLRRNKQVFDTNLVGFTHTRLNQSHSLYSPGIRGMELGAINQEANISSFVKPIEMHVPIDLHSMNQNNSMMMLLMNQNDQFVQFGGASTSGNIQSASSLYYESIGGGCGVVDPMICHSLPQPEPLVQYYVPPVPPPPYMQYNMIPNVAPPQLQWENHDGGQEDIDQFFMKNYKARY